MIPVLTGSVPYEVAEQMIAPSPPCMDALHALAYPDAREIVSDPAGSARTATAGSVVASICSGWRSSRSGSETWHVDNRTRARTIGRRTLRRSGSGRSASARWWSLIASSPLLLSGAKAIVRAAGTRRSRAPRMSPKRTHAGRTLEGRARSRAREIVGGGASGLALGRADPYCGERLGADGLAGLL